LNYIFADAQSDWIIWHHFFGFIFIIMSMQTILKPDAHIDLHNANIGVPNDRQLISIHTLSSAPDTFDREKKYIVAMLVHVKAFNADTALPTHIPFSSQRGMNAFAKKQKTNASYKRVFFFLDLLTQGSCFVIFERDRSDEAIYWRDGISRMHTRVGDVLLITEPARIENAIAGHLSVVRTQRAFIPIPRPESMKTFMPAIPDQDTFVGFNLEQTSIKLQNINAVETSCSGTFCDRLYHKSRPCGCYQTNQRTYGANYVFRQDIHFQSGIAGNDEIVSSCSSLRLTELLFNNPLPANMSRSTYIEPKLQELRDALRAIAEYVNEHGQWTIAGWMRPSLIQEVGTMEQVYSETYGVHISYIYPAQPEILQSEEFRALQKDPTEFLVYHD
jgi:hypothetical protein